jgi:hypothetical protein
VQEGLKSGNVSEACRRYRIAQTLYYRWKDEAEQGAKAALGGRSAAAAETEKDHRIRQLEGTLARKVTWVPAGPNHEAIWAKLADRARAVLAALLGDFQNLFASRSAFTTLVCATKHSYWWVVRHTEYPCRRQVHNPIPQSPETKSSKEEGSGTLVEMGITVAE